MSLDADLHNSHSSAQEVLPRYRGLFRAQRLEAQSAEVLSRKALESLAPLQRAHGLWLGSYATRDVNEARIKRRNVVSYWGDMPAQHGLKHEADTAFRRRVCGLWKPGTRNSVDPAKRDGMRVKRLGGMVAVCKRSLEAEFADPSQGLLDRVMGRSAKTGQLLYHLRPRLVCRLRQALESPLNPPSICLVNIQRLHTLLQATANHNPQRWLLSRRQFVKLLTGSFRGFDIRTAHQLYTCYDPYGRDRVRFAQITSDLAASEHPSTLVLAAAPTDLGPHRLSLTMLRLAYRLHASATPEARGMRYEVVLEMMRSVCLKDEVAAELEEAFLKFIRTQGRNREDEEGEEILLKKLVEEDALIRVYHSCLMTFQSKITMMEEEMLGQTVSKHR